MRSSSLLTCAFVLAGGVLSGCRPPELLAPPVDPGGGYHPPSAVTGLYIDARAEAVVHSSRPLPPISGGTLAATHDGTRIVAADPDRDRIVLIDVATGNTTPIALPAGSEPGRVAIDEATHLAHVVLRGSGEVTSVSLGPTPTITRRSVCAAPRGIAIDSARSLVRVACRDGELVSFDSTLADPSTTTIQTGVDDLRDVIVRGDELVVTRFRSAELVRLSVATGVVLGRVVPASSTSPTSVRANGQPAEFQPSVAWRAIASGDSVIVVHQRASDGELLTAPGAYYSTGVCSGSIVQSAVTFFNGTNLVANATPNISGVTLPVDVARSPSGEIAVVGAGIENTETQPSVARIPETEITSANTGYRSGCVYGRGNPAGYGYGYGEATTSRAGAEYTPNAIAAVYLPDGRLVVQGRDPSVIRIESRTIPLFGGVAFDTGHAFFHADAGRGTACASCHPEAGDDGQTWTFTHIGERRTPPVPAGFLTTAPFHWSGDLPDLAHLMGTVFTERMGGPAVDAQHTAAIGSWLDTRPSDAPRVAIGDAATRGAAVFQRAGCADCHSGGMLTNNQTVDVGTGGRFQVPTLIGVSRSLPAMHNGCAHTLAQRFDPSCGGATHGAITSMNDPRVGDLVAYLETL